MADVLYPGRRPRPLRMGLRFDAFGGPNYPRALELARRSPVFRDEEHFGLTRHYAAFEARDAVTLRALYDLVGPIHTTQVLVDGHAAPYARELFLSLFWIFIEEEA